MNAHPLPAGSPWILRTFRRGAVESGVVTFGRGPDLVFAAVVALAIPRVARGAVPLAKPLVPALDPDRYWFLQTVHQLAALALTLLVMRLVSTRRWADWGRNFWNAGQGLLLALIFAVVMSVPIYLLMDQAERPTTGISSGGIVGVLVTHFLIIGTTQEVLVRGFVMTFLQNRWPKVYRFAGVEVPLSGLLAAVIFMLAHVKPFPPFFWPAQLGFSLGYGVLYAIMIHGTKSLLGPTLAHGYSNTAYVVMLKFS